MRYLFIKNIIANTYESKPKICQFGYLLTNELLNPVKEGVIYMNPGVGEDFSDIEKSHVEIDYSENNYKFYHQQRMFRFFYDEIRELLEQDDLLVIGWKTKNEAYSLLKECDRYKMSRFDFSCFDLQQVYKSVYGSNLDLTIEKVLSLDKTDRSFHKNALQECYVLLEALKNLLTLCSWTLEELLKKKGLKHSFYKASQAYLSAVTEEEYQAYRKVAAKEIKWKNLTRLVFFDFESANDFDGVGKICEVGVVITDMNFKIITKRHLLINPNAKFNLLGRSNGRDLHLFGEANDYEVYRKSPDFKDRYSDLVDIFTLPNSLCVGFSVESDIAFLATDTHRNGMKQLIYTAIDVQWLIRDILGSRKQVSLDNAFDSLLGAERHQAFVSHKSVDDAAMTLEVLRKALEIKQVSLEELVKANQKCVYSSNLFIEKFNAKIRQCEKLQLFRLPKSKDLSSYTNAWRQDESKIDDPAFWGKRYTLSAIVQRIDVKQVEGLIEKIHELGCVITHDFAKTDVLIVLDDQDYAKFESMIGQDKKYSFQLIYLRDIIGEAVNENEQGKELEDEEE